MDYRVIWTPPSRMLRRLPTSFVMIGVFVFAIWGWWSYWGIRMVAAGDLQEACYLTQAFNDFYGKNQRLPNESDLQSFPSRLHFMKRDHDRFLYSCGPYGADRLVIELNKNHAFDFEVLENAPR